MDETLDNSDFAPVTPDEAKVVIPPIPPSPAEMVAAQRPNLLPSQPATSQAAMDGPPDEMVSVVNKNDPKDVRSVPRQHLDDVLNYGYELDNPVKQSVREFAEDHEGTISGNVLGGLYEAGNQALLGVPDIIAKKALSAEDLAKLDVLKSNTLGTMVGGGVGLATGFLKYSPLGLLGKGAGVVGDVVEKTIADNLTTRIGLEVGDQVGKKTISNMAKEMAAKIVSKGVGGAIEGGAYAAPQALTEAMLGDPNAAAESLLIGGGIGGLLGGVAFPLASSIGKAAKVATERTASALGEGGWEAFKKLAKVTTGASEEAIERYAERGEQIYNAKPLQDITQDFLDKSEAISEGISGDSSKGYKILEDAGNNGVMIKGSAVTDRILETAQKLEERGKYSPELQQASERIFNVAKTAEESAAANSGVLSPIEVRRIADQMAQEGYMAKKMGLGNQGQIGSELRSMSGEFKDLLRNAVPGYKEHMASLADDVSSYKSIRDMFRSPGGAENLLKRVMRGKDARTAAAFSDFDQRFGTDFSEQVKDSYAKQQLSGETTNGSRKTLLGFIAGKTLGGIAGPLGATVGEAIGGALGATSDVYGTTAVRKTLDGIMMAHKAVKDITEKLDFIPEALKGIGKNLPVKPRSLIAAAASMNAAGVSYNPQKKHEAIARIREQTAKFAANPEVLGQHFTSSAFPLIHGGAPNVGQAYTNKAISTFNYLFDNMPKPAQYQNPLLPKKDYRPSDQQIHEFEQKLDVIHDPFLVLNELQKGKLNKSHIDTLKTVYPQIYGLMQKRMLEEIHEGNIGAVDYKKRLQISNFLGMPMDNSLKLENIAVYQQSFIGPDETVDKSNAKDVKIAEDAKTDIQKMM